MAKKSKLKRNTPQASTTKKPYRTAKQLGVTPLVRKYLIYAAKTLPKLSTPQKLNGGTFGFDMSVVCNVSYKGWPATDFQNQKCGTAGCILGLMRYKAKLDKVPTLVRSHFGFYPKMDKLFYPEPPVDMYKVTNKHAATTVDRFLRTGKVKFPVAAQDSDEDHGL